jgi:hypothetical protein
LASEDDHIIIFNCFTNLYFPYDVNNIYIDVTFPYSSNFMVTCVDRTATKMVTIQGDSRVINEPNEICDGANITFVLIIKI